VLGTLRIIRCLGPEAELLGGGSDRGGGGLLQGPLLIAAEQQDTHSLPGGIGDLPNQPSRERLSDEHHARKSHTRRQRASEATEVATRSRLAE
jgi:hypothetical protein